MPFASKKNLVKRLAHFAAQLFRKRFQRLGNLYPKGFCDDARTSMGKSLCHRPRRDFTIDRMVSIHFFLADHIAQDVPRGPFNSSKEWLSASLLFHQNDCERILSTSDDEEDLEDAERTARIIRKLSSHMLSVIPPTAQGSPETTALLHDDLSLQNILVDKDGNLTAVVDWECVSALPLWRVCQFPHMLEGKERKEIPEKENYAREENGSYDQLFWDRLMEFEQTVLRGVFLDEMQNIELYWVEMFWNVSSQRKTDFELAVQLCSDEFSIKVLEEWLDELPKLGETRLRNRLV
ncbi:hypothetical protein BWQ96_04979 [Gracilariopsis chorda]|uniref:Aminoglycoside phosphotransferase domain-containing protein n=1 Tax=Gracilariopsis chorda TaxID=448386 RepID=A0A2V3IVW8_9FLOR|nr:hypothetical protein BWQ96_04979 [Gracilariopsis chorda]|eukprot:PXF45280.1 hypothetical protein BWQ96_04979 [Gracilariopsis chorda]